MKKLILAIALLGTVSFNASAQAIYKEVKRIMQNAETVKHDTSKSLDERKVATFKWDAIYYLIMKGSASDSFTEYELGNQTNAMIDYVNRFVKRLTEEKKKKDKDLILGRYRGASVNHPLFNDPEKDVVNGYVDNDKYITQFSLDTNWVEALAEVKNNNW